MSTHALPEDICARRHGGNEESAAANAKIAGTKEAIRLRIYEHALSVGSIGITADEIAEEWACGHNHVAPRISELKAQGLLIPTEWRRETRSGCTARVLVAIPR